MKRIFNISFVAAGFSVAFLILLFSSNSFAQKKPSKRVIKKEEKADSLKFYRSLERFSKKKGKLTYKIFNSIFDLDKTEFADTAIKAQATYKRYANKVIRNINIQTLDPFGYDIKDTTIHPKSFVQKAGNAIHNKSTQFAIRNQLLFKKYDKLDPIKVRESERLLRKTLFVKDLKIHVKNVKGTDSVDVYILEQDLWTIVGGIDVLGEKTSATLEERNFIGLGHTFRNQLIYYPGNGKKYLMGSYLMPSIKNSFISTAVYYNTSPDTFTNGIGINRPFFSPLTKWAGGVDYFFRGSNVATDGSIVESNLGLRFNDLDIWLGRSIPMTRSENEEGEKTNFILTGRYFNHNTTKSALVNIDTMGVSGDSKLYLAGFGLSRRSYYRDYFIYRYGIPEDVPAGSILQFLIGFENALASNRLYTGVNAALGNHFGKFGYVSLSAGYGNFWNHGNVEQGVVSTSIGYFSNLITIGNWKLRQFAKGSIIYGVKRRVGEVVDINEENGIKGFVGVIPDVTNKIVFQLQSQLYLPYNFIGFRFAPFIYWNVGMVGDDVSPFIQNRFYQAFGIGLLLKNELLVFNTFQFSIGFYPYIPGTGYDILKFNPVRTYDFGFRDFEFAKPVPISFQ